MFKKLLCVIFSASLVLCAAPAAAFASVATPKAAFAGSAMPAAALVNSSAFTSAAAPNAACVSVAMPADEILAGGLNKGLNKGLTQGKTQGLAEILAEGNSAWQSDWQGYTNGGSATTQANTPKDSAKEAWVFDYATHTGDVWASCSEPVLAGSYAFIAVNDKLLKIDKATGNVSGEAQLKARISYTCRPAYANGAIVVPQNGGCVQAFSADTLNALWETDALSSAAQASCTVNIDGGYAYVETVDSVWDADAGTSVYSNGYLLKIDMETGAVVWQIHDASDGYYWNGAVVSGDYLIISTLTGRVRAINLQTGEIASEHALNVAVNTDCVKSADGTRIYVVARDGSLFVLSVDDRGQIAEVAKKDIGLTGSTCTPTILDGKMYVGGEATEDANKEATEGVNEAATEGVREDATKDASENAALKGAREDAAGNATSSVSCSALSIVDLSTFAVQTIKTVSGSPLPSGGIKGVPLVSSNNQGTFVYFTVNSAETTDWVNYTSGGGVYSYKVGDADAKLIYDAAGYNQYCDSPVICDAQGCLYYINDSGVLFKLQAENSGTDGKDDSGDAGDDKDNDKGNSDGGNADASDDKDNSGGNNGEMSGDGGAGCNNEGGNESNNDGDSEDDNEEDSDGDYEDDDSDDEGADNYLDDFEDNVTQTSDETDPSNTSSDSANNPSTQTSSATNSNTSNNKQDNSANNSNKNSGEASASTSAVNYTDEGENGDAPFNWLPVLGVVLGVLVAGGAIYALVRAKKSN